MTLKPLDTKRNTKEERGIKQIGLQLILHLTPAQSEMAPDNLIFLDEAYSAPLAPPAVTP